MEWIGVRGTYRGRSPWEYSLEWREACAWVTRHNLHETINCVFTEASETFHLPLGHLALRFDTNFHRTKAYVPDVASAISSFLWSKHAEACKLRHIVPGGEILTKIGKFGNILKILFPKIQHIIGLYQRYSSSLQDYKFSWKWASYSWEGCFSSVDFLPLSAGYGSVRVRPILPRTKIRQWPRLAHAWLSITRITIIPDLESRNLKPTLRWQQQWERTIVTA